MFNSGDSWFGGNLTAYVQNGTIPAGRVDDMAARVLAGFFLLEQDAGYPAVNFDSWDLVNAQNVRPLPSFRETIVDWGCRIRMWTCRTTTRSW